MAKRRLRVLFLIRFLHDTGGGERFALALATHLPRDRFDPWVCCTRGGDERPLRELEQASVPYTVLGRRTKWDVHRFAGLARLLREQRFDILHAHMFGSNVWGTLIGRACRVPVIIAHEQTWSYAGNPIRAWLDGRIIGRLATRFVSVSPADAERMVSYERVPERKIVVIPNAYVPRAAASDGNIRAELGIQASAPVIATAAVFRPQKALDLLLEAHARVRVAIPQAHLLIAGDGQLRETLKRRASELSLDGHVHFLGKRQDVDAILRAADVAALSSNFEGTPLFMFECMANRTPLVATAVGGIPSVLQSGVSGVLVPPRDAQALAEAMTGLLHDRFRRERIAEQAAQLLSPFTIEAVTNRFVELYEQLSAEASAE